MKKKKGVSIFSLWERAAKAKKTTSTSTPTAHSVEIETNESKMQLALVPAQEQDDGEAPQLVPTQNDEVNGEALEADRAPPTPIVEETATDEEGELRADLEALEHDPGKRIPISRYDVNDQDRVRRRYIELGPCQPKKHDFKYREISGHPRRFCPVWFKENKWLEYSVEKDAAFCFVCYLFKDRTKCPGGDTFVNGGWRNWHLKSRLKKHMGAVNSAHAEAQEKYDRFTTPITSIRESIASNTTQYKTLYRLRLTWTLKCLRFLLRQGLAFRGHDESEESLNKGNFLELLNWLAGNFEEVDRVVLKNAPQNCKMTCHEVQHELIKCCAQLTTKLVIEELDGQHFAILADESADVYQNEQLAVCLRYVDKKGRAVVRFLGIAHVEDTSAMTLKAAVEHMLMKYNLTFAMVRGQGYDGASNMKGNANGLKKLIMDESPYAYYVHCFSHQLQLTLVAVAKESGDCTWFFGQLAILLNVLGNSCKKMRMLRMAQAEELIDALELEEIETGSGLNQEMGLGRPSDTRWGSHYKTVLHVIAMYPAIRRVLVKIGKEYTTAEAQTAMTMLTSFRSFEFVFMAHLMQEIFGYTEDLSRALQKKDQDIVNAMELVDLTKFHLQCLRTDDGWKDFLQRVTSFCVKYKIKVVDMEGPYYPVGRPKRGFYNGAINYHRFHVDMFVGVIDRQLQELNDRFDEGSVKDSAFLGVRLADGIKMETSALALRTKRVSTSVAIRAQTAAVSSPSVTPASPSGKKTLRKGTAVITGASSGLGLATAKALAETGKWHVIMACRDFLKASRAAKAAGMDKDSFTIVHLDLASLDSVRQFVKNVRQLEMPIDVVVCNAAVYQPTAKEPSYTADGFEMSVGVNHLGHFLLARELLTDLQSSDYPSKRLIIVGSITGNTNTLAGNVPPKANLGDLRGLAGGLNGIGSSVMIDGGEFDGAKAYKDSKVCNMLTMQEFHRRYHEETGVTFASLYPGCIATTGLFREHIPLFRLLFPPFQKYITKGYVSEEEAGKRLAQVVSDPSLTKSGVYWSWNKNSASFENQLSEEASDADKAKKLWEISEKLVGLA